MYKKFLLYEALKEAREKRKLKAVKHNKTDVCRVCMATNVTMVGIFDCVNRNLAEDIEFCTGILISKTDNLPKKICQSCLQKLKVAYIFKSKCLLTDKKFKSLSLDIEVEIKRERSDDGSQDAIVNTGDDDEFFGDSPPVEENTSLEALLNPLHCDLCGANFPTLLEKRRHIAEKHKKRKSNEKFICELCGKQLANRLTMRGHVRSHQPPNMFCAHCDYKTNNRSDLCKHLKLHTGEKTHQCKYCGRLFTVNSNLRIHIRRIHENDGVRKFVCNFCPMKYSTKISLERHMDGHYNKRNFLCHLCPSRFNNRFTWRKHVKKVHKLQVPSMKGGRVKEHFFEKADLSDWHPPSAAR